MDNKANNTIVIVHIIIYDHNIIVTSYACNQMSMHVATCIIVYLKNVLELIQKLLITLENAASCTCVYISSAFLVKILTNSYTVTL